jgi:hypothetical protein
MDFRLFVWVSKGYKRIVIGSTVFGRPAVRAFLRHAGTEGGNPRSSPGGRGPARTQILADRSETEPSRASGHRSPVELSAVMATLLPFTIFLGVSGGSAGGSAPQFSCAPAISPAVHLPGWLRSWSCSSSSSGCGRDRHSGAGPP